MVYSNSFQLKTFFKVPLNLFHIDHDRELLIQDVLTLNYISPLSSIDSDFDGITSSPNRIIFHDLCSHKILQEHPNDISIQDTLSLLKISQRLTEQQPNL